MTPTPSELALIEAVLASYIADVLEKSRRVRTGKADYFDFAKAHVRLETLTPVIELHEKLMVELGINARPPGIRTQG